MTSRILAVAFGAMLVAAGIATAVGVGLIVLGWFVPGAPWSVEAIGWLFSDGMSVWLLLSMPGMAYVACRLGLAILSAARESGRAYRAPVA